MKVAISYLRFSSVIQSIGDSSRRQNAKRDEWLKQNPDVVLEREMNDFGLSAFKADHVSKGDLGDFLAFIKTKSFIERAKRDDVFLLVESLDRLSREEIMDALAQLKAIVKSGIKVVTLADGHCYDRDSLNDLGDLIVAIVTMSRAHNESAEKSRRIRSVFEKKRSDAKAGKVYSNNCPGWIKLIDGKYQIIRENAKIVSDIIKDISKGKSIRGICYDLNQRKVPTLKDMNGHKNKNRVKGWSSTSVTRLIDYPNAIGNLCTKNGNIKGYYPSIISVEIFAKARQVLSSHKSNRGRTSTKSGFFNFFRKIGLATNGDAIYLKNHGNGIGSYLPRSSHIGKSTPGSTWNKKELDMIFFATIRLALKVEGSTTDDENKIIVLEDQIDSLAKKISNLESLLEDDPDPGLLKRKREREIDRDGLMNQCSDLRDKVLQGGRSTIIDPGSSTDQEIYEAIRSNVAEKGIVVDFPGRTISVELQNGIKYSVAKTETGEVIVETNDFEIPNSFAFVEMKPRTGTREFPILSE